MSPRPIHRVGIPVSLYSRPDVPGLLSPTTPYQYELPGLSVVTTPLNITAWQTALSAHPDQALGRYITNGLRHGFRIGFCRGSPLKSASSNLQSAPSHPEAVNDFIRKELSLGHLLGPLSDTSRMPTLQVNRIGVLPKGHNTGKLRLVTDLSFPSGLSVNDEIDPQLCSLSYTTVDVIAARIALVKALSWPK